MRKRLWILSLCGCLSVILCPEFGFAGGKGVKGGGGKGSTKSQAITVSPSTTTSPVQSGNPIRVCVSGFKEGNFVAIQVPLAGDPDIHSRLAFSGYVDSTGGFCIDSPPAWTDMNLTPGVYRIFAVWAKDRYGLRTWIGPETWLTIVEP